MTEVILTVADHEKNGFISLARWRFADQETAQKFISSASEGVHPDAEPDIKTAPFTFILDMLEGETCVGESDRLLHLQAAMALAPIQVRQWLFERPAPDDCVNRRVPVMDHEG